MRVLIAITTLVVIGAVYSGEVAGQSCPPPVVPVVPGPGEADYRVLDNLSGPWINFNHAPVRPFVFDDDFNEIYAVNTHDSTVVHFANYDVTPEPQAVFRVPWSPVSIALWSDPNDTADPERLLVVCRGNYSLVILRRSTGEIVGLVPLRGEPADLVVVNDHAYVSCPGVDQVAKIDLVVEAVDFCFAVASKQPFFLTRWNDDVLVTPMLSGNNTVVHKSDASVARIAESQGILDLSNNPPGEKLPDEDLFLLPSTAPPPPPGECVDATPLVTELGTTLFGHAIQPGATPTLWVLNTEANNTGTLGNNIANGVMTEPAIRGLVARNRVTRVDLSTNPPSVIGSPVILDQPGGGLYDITKSIGQPFDVAFVPAGAREGTALVVGLLNNRVNVYQPDGTFFFNFDLVEGTLPRAIEYDGTRNRAIVYCWGTNTIEVYSFPANRDVVLDLGHDPTPANVARGREVFYDASHSQYHNASCATCHIEGGMDHEEWDLSCEPIDNKGALVTQTLVGIDKLLPFHWRGERSEGLIDFNEAFPGLLGGTELDTTPDGEFDDFEAFVLSLQSPANPYQHPKRVLTMESSPPIPSFLPTNLGGVPIGDPVHGQDLWFDKESVGKETCNSCHLLPTATNGDVITDGSPTHPKRRRLMVTGFNAMWRKVQDNVEIDVLGESRRYPITGAGFAHSGASTNLLEFTSGGRFDIIPKETSDVASFMHLIDTGIAPAVHDAVLLDLDDHATAKAHLESYLLPQANAGHCEVVAFGTSTIGGSLQTLRWVYNRATGLFDSELSSISQPFSFFDTQAAQGDGSNVFVGMPLGMGRRFGIDFDNDGLPNLEETQTWGSDPLDPHSDQDGFEDGHEVDNGMSDPTVTSQVPNDVTDPEICNLTLDWIGTRQAKLSWTTSEPTNYSITYSGVDMTGGTVPAVTVEDLTTFRTEHSVLLDGLIGSTKVVGFQRLNPIFLEQVTYNGTLTVEDRGQRTDNEAIPTLQPAPFTREPGDGVSIVVEDFQWTQAPDLGGASSGSVTGIATARLRSKLESPNNPNLADAVLIARVMVQSMTDFVPVPSTTFTAPLRFDLYTSGQNGNPQPEHLDGPFVRSTISGTNGMVTIEFTVDVNAGDTVILNLETAADKPGPPPSPITPVPFGMTRLHFPNAMRWSMPDTDATNRKLDALP